MVLVSVRLLLLLLHCYLNNTLYCIFVFLEANIVDRTQQMEQISLTKVNS